MGNLIGFTNEVIFIKVNITTLDNIPMKTYNDVMYALKALDVVRV